MRPHSLMQKDTGAYRLLTDSMDMDTHISPCGHQRATISPSKLSRSCRPGTQPASTSVAGHRCHRHRSSVQPDQRATVVPSTHHLSGLTTTVLNKEVSLILHINRMDSQNTRVACIKAHAKKKQQEVCSHSLFKPPMAAVCQAIPCICKATPLTMGFQATWSILRSWTIPDQSLATKRAWPTRSILSRNKRINQKATYICPAATITIPISLTRC